MFSLAFSIVLVYIENVTAELENVTFMSEIAINKVNVFLDFLKQPVALSFTYNVTISCKG